MAKGKKEGMAMPAAEFDLAAKRDAVLQSKMPEAEKQRYLKELGLKDEGAADNKISFSVYAKLRRISLTMQKAMQAYPPVKSLEMGTLEQWDEVCKKF